MLLAKRAWKFPRTPLKLPVSALHVRKSMCHLTRLEYDSAVIEAQMALKFNAPERTQLQAHIALALCFSARGQYSQAHQTLQAALAPAISSDLSEQYVTNPSPAPALPEDEGDCKRAKESLPPSHPLSRKRDPLHPSAAASSLSQPGTGGGGGGGGGSKSSERGAEARTGDVEEGGGGGSGEGCLGGGGEAERGTDVRRQMRVVMRLLYHTAKVSKETE